MNGKRICTTTAAITWTTATLLLGYFGCSSDNGSTTPADAGTDREVICVGCRDDAHSGGLAEKKLVNPGFTGTDPLSGWTMSGGPFVTVDQCGGHYLSTYNPNSVDGGSGEVTTGSLEQSFVPGPSTKSLCFSIWGGAPNTDASLDPGVSIRLLHDGAVVREAAPTNNNMDPPACTTSPSTAGDPFVWDLTGFVGESLTLEVHDSRQDGYGFILTTPFKQGNGSSCQ